ncbi:hypothetical protein, partial [Bacillus badius]|uniref:hypothetical protein n=2 Tax=Bacillus badius TaxID=1455 RepID=UPI001E2DD4AF
MIKREGVYSYQCGECETLFAVVSRLSVSRDKQSTLICPRCSTSSQLTGEGYIAYHLYDKEKREEEKTGLTPEFWTVFLLI